MYAENTKLNQGTRLLTHTCGESGTSICLQTQLSTLADAQTRVVAADVGTLIRLTVGAQADIRVVRL